MFEKWKCKKHGHEYTCEKEVDDENKKLKCTCCKEIFYIIDGAIHPNTDENKLNFENKLFNKILNKN